MDTTKRHEASLKLTTRHNSLLTRKAKFSRHGILKPLSLDTVPSLPPVQNERTRGKNDGKNNRKKSMDFGIFSGMDWTKQVDRMRIFICFEHQRQIFEVANRESIKELKERTREAFHIAPDQGPPDMEIKDQKILTLTYAGARLADHWTLGDIGMPNGSTLRAVFTLETKACLYIYCAFNEEVLPILDQIDVHSITGETLRGMISREVGLPVTVFRICTLDGQEIFDKNMLRDYGVKFQDTLRLDVWDGWKEFLNLCIMGFTRHVLAYLPADDVMARFYQKVAMYIAAHFGHVDLAVTLLKQGIRADEAVGEHPMRQWCKDQVLHIDAMKAPVHEAAEAGSLSVLRSFVHANVCNVLAKDGNDLTPLNLALRKKQKPCASFLLTKQWNKISYCKNGSVHLSIYVKMKRWAERSRNKVLLVYGQWKSSIKNPKKHIKIGALLGQGVQLDGFSKDRMTTMPEAEYQYELEEERLRKERLYTNPIPPQMDPDVYFKTMKRVQDRGNLPQLNKFNSILQKTSRETEKDLMSDKSSDASDVETGDAFDTRNQAFRPRSNSHGGTRLPPITEKKRTISTSQQNLSTINLEDTEFRGRRKSTMPENKRSEPRTRPSLLKPTQSQQSMSKISDITEGEESPRRKKKDVRSPVPLAKIKTEGGSIPLSMSSGDGVARPFIRSQSEDLTKGTLNLYEKYRGLGSRDYAIKCLTVANSFSEKPWLLQVQQALAISKQGVKKAISKQPHMFAQRESDANNGLPDTTIAEGNTSTTAIVST